MWTINTSLGTRPLDIRAKESIPLYVDLQCMAALFDVIFLLLAVESNAVTAPSGECSYLYYYFGIRTSRLLPSLVPSSSSSCLAGYNSTNPSAYCVAECQSLYSVYSGCASRALADNYASNTCGQFNNSDCAVLRQQDSSLVSAISSACKNATYCSPSCVAAIAALEQFSGCCQYDALNGPKALCGQQPIAPCSTVLNSGSVVTPSRECAYARTYLGVGISEVASLTPSLHTTCRSTLAKGGFAGNICIAECQSLFTLLATCFDVILANYYSSSLCGTLSKQNCSSLYVNETLSSDVQSKCSNSTYCSPSCVGAIAALEQYGGCCYAYILNGPKVLCGQQTISDCSTVINWVAQPTPTTTPQSGSATTPQSGSATTPQSGFSEAVGFSSLLTVFAISVLLHLILNDPMPSFM